MIETDERVRELLETLAPRSVEQPEWEDVLARLETLEEPRPHWPLRARRIWRPALLVGVVAATAVGLLGVTAPWRGGPTVLERASAAIRSPSAAQVLYMSYNEKTLGCCRLLGAQTAKLWVHGSTPRRFRVVFPGVGAPLDEGGGTFDPRSGWTIFRYDSRTDTLERVFTGSHITTGEFDPVAIVRRALAAGTARVAGTAVVDGRQTTRIELSALDRHSTRGTALYYVDPNTYGPIGIDFPHLVELRRPFEPVFGNGIYRVRIRFSAFEYLPATPENRKLADIRAMHPTAKVR